MTAAAPEHGWFCTTFRPDWSLHLLVRGGRPIIYRAATDTKLPGMVLRRHDGPNESLIVLSPSAPVPLAPGLWVTASKNSPRIICVHADPSVRTSRPWHYHLNPEGNPLS